jgi:hypothetical protein
MEKDSEGCRQHMKNASKPQTVPYSTFENVPTHLSISLGCHFGSSYSVELEGALLTYKRSKPVQDFPPNGTRDRSKFSPPRNAGRPSESLLICSTCGAGSHIISRPCATVPRGAMKLSIRIRRFAHTAAIAFLARRVDRFQSSTAPMATPSSSSAGLSLPYWDENFAELPSIYAI